MIQALGLWHSLELGKEHLCRASGRRRGRRRNLLGTGVTLAHVVGTRQTKEKSGGGGPSRCPLRCSSTPAEPTARPRRGLASSTGQKNA